MATNRTVIFGYHRGMADSDFPEPPQPGRPPVSGPDPQQAALDRIQYALANDAIAFEELDGLYERVYAATTPAEIEAAVMHLPEPVQLPPPNMRHFAPASSFSFLGDVKIGGWLAVGPKLSATSLIGDTVIDVSSAVIPEGGLDISATSLIGDVKIIVPDGARVQASVTSFIGDRKQALAEPIADGPVIRITSFNVVGDTKVYSLSLVPEGTLRRAWAALRGVVSR